MTSAEQQAMRIDESAARNFYFGAGGVNTILMGCVERVQSKIESCNPNDAARRSSLRDQFSRQMSPELSALNAASDAAVRAARAAAANQTAGTGGSNNGGGSGSSSAPTPGDGGASIAARSPGCAEDIARVRDQGQALGQARAATIFDRTIRNVSARAAIDAAMCIDKLMDKINEVTTAFSAIVSSLNNPLVAILVMVAAQILAQIVDQMIDNVINAVCNAADEIYQAIDNRLKNALCIKGDFGGGGFDPLDFEIDIPAMQCSGWSVDLLSGNVLGQPIEGLNVDWTGVRNTTSNILSQERAYQTQRTAIMNNANLTESQRQQQLNQLCRDAGRTDCRN